MAADIDTELLISLVQKRPVLWDKFREDYKSRACTTESWREVCIKINPDFESLSGTDKNKYGRLIINRWKNVKDQFIKSVKKRKRKSGSGGKTARNYIYHEQLSFLKVTMDMRETESSFETDPDKSPGEVDEEKEDCQSGEVSATKKAFKMAPKRKKVDIEREILEHLSSKEDRHLSFIKGVLPSLEEFTEDETLQFQSGVISVIQNIKKARSFQIHDLQHLAYNCYPPHRVPDCNNPSPSGRRRSDHNSPTTLESHIQPPTCISASPAPSDISDFSSSSDPNFAGTYNST